MKTVIPPSRCTAKLPDDLDKPYLVAEPKMDGSRYVMYIGFDPYGRRAGNTLLSRRVSVVDGKHVDRTDNLPHITSIGYGPLDGTIIDGEVQAADFLATNSIMNSSPALAVAKQLESGYCTYHAFDVLFFRGRDVRGLALEKRRLILEEVCKRMTNDHVKVIPQIRGDLMAEFNRIVKIGGEGVIIKDLRKGYGLGWAKLKRTVDVSCVISGFKPGNGKYSTSLGAIALSVYDNGKLIEIGFASGFDDATRNAMAAKPNNFMGKVVDIFAQEIQKKGAP